MFLYSVFWQFSFFFLKEAADIFSAIYKLHITCVYNLFTFRALVLLPAWWIRVMLPSATAQELGGGFSSLNNSMILSFYDPWWDFSKFSQFTGKPLLENKVVCTKFRTQVQKLLD